MKSKTKNILTFISGGLLLTALVTHLINPGSLTQDLLLIAASLVAGYPVMIKAFQALRMKAFSIDLLVTIAVVGAMIIGEYTESAVVTFLFLFGDYLEGRTLRKARSSMKSLMSMAPAEAVVLREGARISVPADEVRIGDRVVILSGGRIPVDGIVVSGQAVVNESAITGESVPFTKRVGDRVYSSTLSDNGYLEIIAEKIGANTAFSKIIELVEEAQETKAKTQKFMEKFASFYTPGIIVLSLLVWMITLDVHLALTFLVIACPGALVISVPVSIVAGIGNGAKNGILIKGGDKIENLARINAIVFDKTGTLTKGEPEVTALKAFGISETELLKLAAEVEAISEHHLGKAIVKKAASRGLRLEFEPTEVEIIKGHGLNARLGSHEVYVGNKTGALKQGISIEPNAEAYAWEQQEKGNTVVLIASGKLVLGIISIADKIREEAPEALRELRNIGVNHTVMLTGDNKTVARQVASQLGIDQVFAELLPEDKVRKVNACKGVGAKLAMVGDGINDAPAIAAADVGIAMGNTGTDVTMETADIILMSDNLSKLPYALQLAKATVRNMKQNTYFALITVVVLLIGVLTGNVHLASGMLIHEASVLLVILNAVRLVHFSGRRFKANRFQACTKKSQEAYSADLAFTGCSA